MRLISALFVLLLLSAAAFAQASSPPKQCAELETRALLAETRLAAEKSNAESCRLLRDRVEGELARHKAFLAEERQTTTNLTVANDSAQKEIAALKATVATQAQAIQARDEIIVMRNSTIALLIIERDNVKRSKKKWTVAAVLASIAVVILGAAK